MKEENKNAISFAKNLALDFLHHVNIRNLGLRILPPGILLQIDETGLKGA